VTALKESAEEYARAAVGYGEDDYANHWDLAFVLLNRGKDQEAMAVYDRALALFDYETDELDRRNDLLVDMAEACIFTGDIDRAMYLLDRAVRIPDWYRWIRAWAEFNAQRFPEAIAQINAMRKKPGEPGYVPDIQLLLAVAYACNDQPEAADEALNRPKTLRPAWTLAKELERNPFVRPEDRRRRENGMKRAKFS
jgi:tetratricopeptide (TPR) repeat protein